MSCHCRSPSPSADPPSGCQSSGRTGFPARRWGWAQEAALPSASARAEAKAERCVPRAQRARFLGPSKYTMHSFLDVQGVLLPLLRRNGGRPAPQFPSVAFQRRWNQAGDTYKGLILSPRASARSSAPPRSNRMLRMRGAIRHCSTDSLFQLLHAPARMGISHYYPRFRTHPRSSPGKGRRGRRTCTPPGWPGGPPRPPGRRPRRSPGSPRRPPPAPCGHGFRGSRGGR
ncbi:hypothetical protein METESE_26780 [Mesoterricola sediminis]|uniref:Uncharacterized protein n=1 Tax=Mesoterricola sediminis TaxID=2927980 RepID=A0AA48KE53_9BACT|nr:hypothetical protein METESE_26780 [Mesoterricola sediminis]